jgi:hypothetical protein
MMTPESFESLAGSREPGGAGDVGGSSTAVDPVTPAGGYGRPFAASLETDVERAAPRAGSSNLGPGETGGPGPQAWEGPLP